MTKRLGASHNPELKPGAVQNGVLLSPEQAALGYDVHPATERPYEDLEQEWREMDAAYSERLKTDNLGNFDNCPITRQFKDE